MSYTAYTSNGDPYARTNVAYGPKYAVTAVAGSSDIDPYKAVARYYNILSAGIPEYGLMRWLPSSILMQIPQVTTTPIIHGDDYGHCEKRNLCYWNSSTSFST